MGDSTSISWTDATWNTLRGCTRVSEGCRNCYAERIAARFSDPGLAYEGLATRKLKVIDDDDQFVDARWTGEIRWVSEHLMDPFRWRKPRRIFTNSMSDLFHEKVTDWMIDRVVAVMLICCDHESRGGHTFQTLTKRAERMRDYLSSGETLERVATQAGQLMEDGDGWYDSISSRPRGLLDPKLWWGVSCENGDAEGRLRELAATPADVRFISAEPLIGPVSLVDFFADAACREGQAWVIAGCESGPRARPCAVDWLRGLRDQCAAASAPFFLKQAVDGFGKLEKGIAAGDGARRKGGGVIELPYLDGVQHKAFPS